MEEMVEPETVEQLTEHGQQGLVDVGQQVVGFDRVVVDVEAAAKAMGVSDARETSRNAGKLCRLMTKLESAAVDEATAVGEGAVTLAQFKREQLRKEMYQFIRGVGGNI